MRISDWSSDVCSSDLELVLRLPQHSGRAELAPFEHFAAPRDQAGHCAILPDEAADGEALAPFAHGYGVEGAVFGDAPEIAATGQRFVFARAIGDRKSTRLNSSH